MRANLDCLDRNTLNIVSLILGTVSLAVALTAYSAPEINRTFIGANPFAVKRDIISSHMTYLFTAIAVLAVAIQVVMAILDLPERIHTTTFYTWLGASCLITSLALAHGLLKFGRFLARRSWRPKMVEMQKKVYENVADIIDHDGTTAGQRAAGVDISQDQKNANFETARERLEHLESLFEIVPRTDGLMDRLNVIRIYFTAE